MLRASALAVVHKGAPVGGPSGSMSGMSGPVHAQTAEILAQLKQARMDLEVAASAAMTLSPAIRAIKRTELRLERPLRVAIVGEFNSGKSSLANLLARIESLPTAVISSTCIP